MTTNGNIHKDDVGTVITLTVKEDGVAADISTATELQLRFWKPSDTSTYVEPTFVTDGDDGQVTYTTLEGDLDEVGVYKLQVVVTLPSGKFHSDIVEMRVWENIEVVEEDEEEGE